ncbi:MAG: penicillin-binding protein 2 [Candidatus Kerfeldbacteria bacterium]|nr:penicillin-binding protein 2 [Candidatus Kerfeldbacteria bacterium]
MNFSRLTNPFTSVPLSADQRPLIVRRDRRGLNVEDYLAPGASTRRLSANRVNVTILALILLLALLALLTRVAYLQLAKGERYRFSSERNRIRLEVQPAPRGVIYDRHRTPLLTNIPSFTLLATPADLPRGADERTALVSQLARAYPTLGADSIQTALAISPVGSIQPVILSDHVSYEDALRLSTVIARLPGISLEAISTRAYRDGTATAHLLGYLGKPTPAELERDNDLTTLSSVGRMGIELAYDRFLRGQDGVREVERDHLNKELAVIASREAEPGHNLILTIDEELQQTLSQALEDTIHRLRVPGGAAVALDPRTGEVLALVSQPSFDPNQFSQGGNQTDFRAIFDDERHPLFFRAISGSYPSGSTIKPVIAAAALDEGVITERTTVQSVGGIRVGPNFFPDWKTGGHGTTDVRKALAESVNTFFYLISAGFEDFSGLGIERVVNYLARFGLGRRLGIDLPNEAAGFLPDRAWRSKPSSPRWYVGDTYNLAIGQGFINVTPLQVADYTAAIANGGTLYQPFVVKEILAADGQTTQAMKPKSLNQTVADQFLASVRAGMRQAVTGGSARALGDLPVAVAAKTGTAQFGNENKTHAWLTSFAPFDRPEIVVTVVVEAGGEGHAAALPMAKRALAAYFAKTHRTP